MVDKRLTSATSGATKGHGRPGVPGSGGAIKSPIRENGLTDKQRIFVKIYTENEGRMTATECARQRLYCKRPMNAGCQDSAVHMSCFNICIS